MVSVFELVHNIGLIDGCDAIISTVPLGNITSIPQILVNALLTQEDIDTIKDELGLKEYLAVPSEINSQFNFNEIINRETVMCGVDGSRPMEVIDKVGSLLFGIDAIWPSYIKAMKNLYSLYGPYMVIAPNTTLLHAGPEMGSKKLAISLITLKNPIEFGHKVFDPVRIAMAFSSPVNSVHTNALSSIFTFFSIPQNRENIIAAETVDEILDILGHSDAVQKTQ
jgi:mannitol/fructose-specific phosphotransferase system IIA component (Ntr-type)